MFTELFENRMCALQSVMAGVTFESAVIASPDNFFALGS
jgi:hypothetical protein